MAYFNYNGKFYTESSLVFGPDNRSLRYGDGLFETLKCIDGDLIFIDEHFSRLWKGMKLFQFEIPKLFTPDLLQDQIIQLINKNKITSARIRITVARGNGGLYDFKNQFQYFIQCWEIEKSLGRWNENGLQVTVFHDAKKMADNFSNCKHNNYLPYFMGALFAKKHKCNDAIILNNNDRICDSPIANIFIIKDGNLSTPSLQEGCVNGIFRKFLIHSLPDHGFPVNESAVTREMLQNADEVFFTNSIFNIRWVSNVDNTSYTNKITREIYNILLETNPSVFC
ncbi:MAG: aminotransferase class IV [Ferruginibacter sp.]